jgi:hypothetical protein
MFVGGWGYGWGDGGGYPPNSEAAPPNVTVVVQQPPPGGQGSTVFNPNYMPNAIRPPEDDNGYNGGAATSSSGMRTYEAPLPYATDPPDETQPARPVRPRMSPSAGRSTGGADVYDQKATIYLIAFKDQSIQAAYACWVEGNTLHYVTVQGSHNRATLDLIDRDLSDRLNRDRGVDFPLTHPTR